MDEYNVYINDEFYKTMDVFQVADLLQVEPEKVNIIYKQGGRFKKYRIAKILKPYEHKPPVLDIWKEWEKITREIREKCKK